MTVTSDPLLERGKCNAPEQAYTVAGSAKSLLHLGPLNQAQAERGEYRYATFGTSGVVASHRLATVQFDYARRLYRKTPKIVIQVTKWGCNEVIWLQSKSWTVAK